MFGIGLTGFALLWFTRWWRSQLVLRQRYSDQLFDLAAELVHDDRLDDSRLEALRTLAAMALDRTAYDVLRAIVRAIEDGSAPRLPIGEPHPDIAQNWHSLVYAWTMAVSCERIYGGVFSAGQAGQRI